MDLNYETLRSKAAEYGQEHVFQYWNELDDAQQKSLLKEAAAVDFALVSRLAARIGESSGTGDLGEISAADAFPAEPKADQRDLYVQAMQKGQDLLRQNKVSVMVVAGGQGTRLGFDAPKGTFKISPIKDKSLFQLFAESILATRNRYQCQLPWYIMTSEATDEPTRRYFEENDFFGLGRSEVTFFQQGVMPAVDRQGKVLLADKHAMALSPNGHGGSLTALKTSGVLEDMRKRGIEALSYFQVDNPLVSPANPLFIGLHAMHDAQVSSIAVGKADDLERVGNFVSIDGSLQVIEYSDLPDELAHRKNPDGSRMLDAGSVAIHVFDRAFIEQLTSDQEELALPWHIANKKVSYLDPKTQAVVEPDEPNATKFELFIFDAIPLAQRTILLMQDRAECFSPVKNAEGVDSPATTRRDMIARAVKWLEHCGAKIPRNESGHPNCTLEISPLRALDADHLKETMTAPPSVAPGDSLYID